MNKIGSVTSTLPSSEQLTLRLSDQMFSPCYKPEGADSFSIRHTFALGDWMQYDTSAGFTAKSILANIATEAPDPKPQINHYGPMLHNIIMAIALAFSDEVHLRERSLRDKFVFQGKTSLDAECQKPTLSTVQSLDLLSSYYSGMGDQTLGFMYFGLFAGVLVLLLLLRWSSNIATQAWLFEWGKRVCASHALLLFWFLTAFPCGSWTSCAHPRRENCER